jgi:DNA-binding NarL/FixJ family response regulator/Tfp pilus assembly protein PilF
VLSLLDRGRAALADAHWADAQAAFERAIGAEGGPEAHDGLAYALWWLGQLQPAMAHWELAYVAYAERDDRTNAGRVAMLLSTEYLAAFGNRAASDGWELIAGRLLDGLETCRDGILLELRRTARLKDPVQAGERFDRALTTARSIGDRDVEILALSAYGRAMVAAGRLREGFALLDEAMARTTAGEVSDHWLVADTSCNLLIACERAYDLARAAEWCRIAEDWAKRRGCRPFFAFCRVTYGGVLFARGRWAEAEDELADAVRRYDETHPAARPHAIARLAELRVAQGDIAQAGEILQPWHEHPACGYAAAVLERARGELDLAADRLERRITAVAPDPSLLAPLYEALSDVCLARGDRGGAQRSGASLVAIAEHNESRTLRAMSDATLGAIAADAGAGEAIPMLSRALDAYVELGMPYRAARVQLAMAHAQGRARPPAAVGMARAALATFEDLGALPAAESAAELIRSLEGSRPSIRRRAGSSSLTQRENQVLALLAEGLSNPQIAERLAISPKTAEHHVCSILAKLDLKTRAAAAAWSARQSEEPSDREIDVP